MTVFALVAWLVTAALGVVALVRWLRRRRPGSTFPSRLVVGHVATVVLGLGLWATYVASGQLVAAWLTFAVVNVSNGLGDALLLGRFRALAGSSRSWVRDYRRALRAVVSGRYPPLEAAHGLLGGVTFVSTLAACLLGTWA